MSKNAIIFTLFGINKERYSLLEESVMRMAGQAGEKEIFLVHNILPDEESQLPENILNNLTYIRAVGNPVVWQKEAMYNLGAQKALANGAQNLVFSDGDIIPDNDQWLQRIERALKKNDWVHGGKTVVYLTQEATEQILQDKLRGAVNPQYAKDPQFFEVAVRSRVYILQKRGPRAGKVGFPGGIWAVNRTAWYRYRGWDLHNIVGGGDLLHFNRLTLRFEEENHRSYGNLRALLFNPVLHGYAQKDGPWKISYTDSIIYHLWHGGMETRKYETRYAVLLLPQYQPLVGLNGAPQFSNQHMIDIEQNIYSNEDMLLDFNKSSLSYRTLFTQMANYFYSRQDASVESINRYLAYREADFRFSLCPESGNIRIEE